MTVPHATCLGTRAFLEEVTPEQEQGGPGLVGENGGLKGHMRLGLRWGGWHPSCPSWLYPEPATPASRVRAAPRLASDLSGFHTGPVPPSASSRTRKGLPPSPCELPSVPAPKLGVPQPLLGFGAWRRCRLPPLPVLPPTYTSELPLGSPSWVPLGGRQGQRGLHTPPLKAPVPPAAPQLRGGAECRPRARPPPWTSW